MTTQAKHVPGMPSAFWLRFNTGGIYHYYVNGKYVTRRVAAILIAEGVQVERQMWRGEKTLPPHREHILKISN